MRARSAWEQVALLSVTQTCKSLVLALALLHSRLSPREAARLSRLEEETQVDEWGRVEGSHDVDRVFTGQAVGAAGVLLQLLPDGGGGHDDVDNDDGGGGADGE